MWKRLTLFLKRLLISSRRVSRPRRGRSERQTVDARAQFWSDVHAGQQEAEAASLPRPLAPTAKS